MPVVNIKGQWYRVPEGADQADVVAAVKAAGGDPASLRTSMSPTPPQAKPKPKNEVERRADKASMRDWLPHSLALPIPRGIANQFLQGGSYGFNDEITGAGSAATRGVVNAIRKGSIDEIGKEYYNARDSERLSQDRFASENKTLSTGARVIGALLAPTPKFAVLDKLGKAGRVAAAGYDKIGKVGRAALSGGGYAALSGAGEADNIQDIPEAMAVAAPVGAVFGGAAGGLTQLARSGARALKSQSPEQASNMAYNRVSRALQDSPRYRGSQLRHTPESAAREIAVARQRGTDASVMDLSPEMQTLAAYVRRKPASGIQNDLFEFGSKRMEGRNNSFDAQVKENLVPTTGQDALARAAQLKGAHKAEGANYERLVNEDIPVNWSDDLNKLIYSDRPTMKSAIRTAYNRVIDDGLNPAQVGFERLADGTLKITEAPTWRTMDYIRRALGSRAKMLRSKPDGKELARTPDAMYRELRDELGKANPEYADMLSKQRSIFEKEEGLDLGQSILQRLNREPRVVLQEINSLKADQLMDTRTGFVEKVLNVRNQKGNPVNSFKAMLENPDQRAVLAKMFGSSKNLNRFHKWLQREARSARADALTAGKQSVTADVMLMADEAQSPTQELVTSGLHGIGFGGAVGGSSKVVNLLNRFKNHLSPHAVKELGKILMGDGSDLAAGIAKSKAAKRAADAADIEAVRNIARISGYETGKQLGK